MSISKLIAACMLLVLLVIGVNLLNSHVGYNKQTVSILAWPTSFSREQISEFTKQTGISVIYDNTASDEFSETKALVGHSGYDVINITAQPFISHLLSAKAIQILDRSRIPNLLLQDPKLLSNFESQDERDSVGLYYWGTTGIGLSSKAKEHLPANADLSSSALIFDPAYAKKLGECGLTVLDSATDMIPLALLYLGLNPDDLSEDALNRVVKLFDGVRPYIRKFDNSSYKRGLAEGDICAAVGWSEAIYLADAASQKTGSGNSIDYIIPREGGLIWMSGFVIPTDAPDRANAETFINYFLSKEAGAALTNNVMIASAVPSSRELLSPAVLANPITFPKELSNLNYTSGPTKQDDLSRMNRAWERIKNGF
ncbi:extracellular solute-binding protein [Brucella pseudogrignonensis]